MRKKIAEWEASGTGSMSHTVHDPPYNLSKNVNQLINQTCADAKIKCVRGGGGGDKK